MKGDTIRYKSGYKYQLVKTYSLQTEIYPERYILTPFICLTVEGVLTIWEWYAWDGASGPTIDTPSSMRASLVHDALYQLMRLGLLDQKCRQEVDVLFRDICLEDEMNRLRADVWYGCIRLFAAGAAKRGTENPILTAP